MENKVKELKELGYDITNIIEGAKHPNVIAAFYRFRKNQDVVMPSWTEESIAIFSNRIYDIVTKTGENYEKESFQYGKIRGD